MAYYKDGEIALEILIEQLFTYSKLDPITQLFAALIGGVAFAYTVYVLVYYFSCKSKRINKNVVLLNQAEETGIALKETLDKNFSKPKDKIFTSLWAQYSDHLITSADKKNLYSTVGSNYFFNTQSLFPGLSSNRFVVSIPNFLVAVGVLGTFTGLVLGLKSLDIDVEDTSLLKTGINELITSASIAFTTSVYGVIGSLITSLFEKFFERRAYVASSSLVNALDNKIPLISNEQSLLHIEDYSEQSKSALQTLHEKIGAELQKSVTNMGAQVQDALTTTLNSIMKPAIDTLINTSKEQSSQALHGLVSEFMGGMHQAGKQQADEMHNAAKSIQESMQQIGEQLHQVFDRLNSQQDAFLQKSNQQQSSYNEQQRVMQSALAKLLQEQHDQQQSLVSATQGYVAEVHDQQQELISTITSRQQAFVDQLKVQQQNIQEQAAKQEEARQEKIHAAIENISNEQSNLLGELVEFSRNIKEQNQLLVQHHEALGTQLNQAIKGLEVSSRNLDSSGQQLGLLSSNTRAASTELANALDILNTSLSRVSENSAQHLDMLQQHSRSFMELKEQLASISGVLGEAAQLSTQGFKELENHQSSFLSNLRSEIGTVFDSFAEQVEHIEKQAEQWLRNYSEEVQHQTSDRLQQWNEQTLSFVNEMKNTVNTISNIVDDIDHKVANRA